jgi:NADH dehydrogenase FAD-containing subunit
MEVPNRAGIFVVGDAATLTEGALPGVAQVALQQGRYVGAKIARDLARRPVTRPFRYRDKGAVAVVPDPTNLIQVVLRGVGAHEGIPGVVMPSFSRALSDADIVRIAAYLRRTRTSQPPWTDLDTKVAAIRRQINATQ